MNGEQAWIAAVAGAASAAAGWLARGFAMASQWGTLRAEVASIRGELHEFKRSFADHLADDRDRQARLDDKLAGISRDLNQLIGEVRGKGDG